MGQFCLMLAVSTKHESILNASSVCMPVFTLSISYLIFAFAINCNIHNISCRKNVSLVTRFLSKMNAWPRTIGMNSYILSDTFEFFAGRMWFIGSCDSVGYCRINEAECIEWMIVANGLNFDSVKPCTLIKLKQIVKDHCFCSLFYRRSTLSRVEFLLLGKFDALVQ